MKSDANRPDETLDAVETIKAVWMSYSEKEKHELIREMFEPYVTEIVKMMDEGDPRIFDLYKQSDIEKVKILQEFMGDSAREIQETSRVFISYYTRDGGLASRLSTMIRWAFPYCKTFVAGDNLIGGDSWNAVIKDNLIDCDVLIVLCSQASMQRQWVLSEIGAGWIKSKKTIPILLDGMNARDLPDLLSGFHALSVTDKKFYENFILSLEQALGKVRGPDYYSGDYEKVLLAGRIAVWSSDVQNFSGLNLEELLVNFENRLQKVSKIGIAPYTKSIVRIQDSINQHKTITLGALDSVAQEIIQYNATLEGEVEMVEKVFLQIDTLLEEKIKSVTPLLSRSDLRPENYGNLLKMQETLNTTTLDMMVSIGNIRNLLQFAVSNAVLVQDPKEVIKFCSALFEYSVLLEKIRLFAASIHIFFSD